MYIVEGNIGVGKSTFLNLIKQHNAAINIVPEPVENWATGRNGSSLLSLFYEKPDRWAFTLENLAMICRVREHIKNQTGQLPYQVMERSIYSGHYVFALNGKKSGYFSSVEWEIYSQWVEFLLESRCNPPLGFIYLKADPEICYQRMLKRNRESESSLSLEYMRMIHDAHEDFLSRKIALFKHLQNVPVLTLDCTIGFEHNEEIMREHMSKLSNFFKLGADEQIIQTNVTQTPRNKGLIGA